MFSCRVSNYVVYITFWWLINFSKSNDEDARLNEELAKLEADFITYFGAQGRLNWDQIKPIQYDSALLADMCDNAHIQAGRGQITLRESRIVNAVIRFRNASYGRKEVDAIKCRPKVGRDSQFINTHPNIRQPHTNITIPRRPSINPNRKMEFGLHTLEMDSENQKGDKITEQLYASNSSNEIDRQMREDLERKLDKDYHQNSKKKTKGDLELDKSRLDLPDRRGENQTVKNNEENDFDPEETACQMSESDDRQGNTLRRRRGKSKGDLEKKSSENQSTGTVEIVMDQERSGLKQNGDQPNKNRLNELAGIDPNVKYLEKKKDFVDNSKETANKRKYDFDSGPSQRVKGRDTFEEASSSSSHYPGPNSPEIRDPDTNIFYLTQGLREECVFYLHNLIDKSTFYDEVRIVRHVCGLIIPPDKISDTVISTIV